LNEEKIKNQKKTSVNRKFHRHFSPTASQRRRFVPQEVLDRLAGDRVALTQEKRTNDIDMTESRRRNKPRTS
jgi:hypothetical protein